MYVLARGQARRDGQHRLARSPIDPGFTVRGLMSCRNRYAMPLCIHNGRLSVYFRKYCYILWYRIAICLCACTAVVNNFPLKSVRGHRVHTCTTLHVFHGFAYDGPILRSEIPDDESSGGEDMDDDAEAENEPVLVPTQPVTVCNFIPVSTNQVAHCSLA